MTQERSNPQWPIVAWGQGDTEWIHDKINKGTRVGEVAKVNWVQEFSKMVSQPAFGLIDRQESTPRTHMNSYIDEA